MKTLIKQIAKRTFPRALRFWIRGLLRWRWFRGHHGSWREARLASVGYDDQAVLRRALAAAQAVRAGQGIWERDGMVFANPAVHAPLLAALRRAAATNQNSLVVIDIGGAFGSVWWQHRIALNHLAAVTWRVVEQPTFVAEGRQKLTADGLGFYTTLSEAGAGVVKNVALLSSVLPYIESPWQLIAEVVDNGFEHVIIDRTPFVRSGPDQLTVQHVPPELGGGSYPCWIFSLLRMKKALSDDYDLVDEWPGFDELDPEVEFRGFHFQRKKHASAADENSDLPRQTEVP